ncbi:macrophage mannose receptor 1-like [Cyprinodon tularosa]|uniref:macrophage mannose receptor 1-like n=1 Tax=Cyprinodon tularosa TaxID=77115 RepID=UPI0018E1DC84|nr:macrophage mannose receptor 1-like [Cyprinodon tularosa]
MEKCGFFLLMIAGLLVVCDLQPQQTVRQFRYVGLLRNWSEAQTYCRESFFDLATIQNSDNNTEARQAAGTSKVWIGLFNGTWRWSKDENQLSPTSSSYNNLGYSQHLNGQCVNLASTGAWSTSDCEDLHNFICYDASTNLDIVVMQKKSWSDAQSHCRSTYTDLTTIRDSAHNHALAWSLLTRFTSYGWIGLHRSDWVWSDNSSISYLPLGAQTSTEEANCVMMDSSLGSWIRRPCSERYGFLCSTDVVPSMMRMVKIRVDPGSADLNDPEVQESILQQLKKRVEDQGEEVELRWKVQPDGKIFHREEKRAPPGVCETETCDTP